MVNIEDLPKALKPEYMQGKDHKKLCRKAWVADLSTCISRSQWEQWSWSLVGFLIDRRNFSVKRMWDCIYQLFKPSGWFKVLKVGSKFYFYFEKKEEMQRLLLNSPFSIEGALMHVQVHTRFNIPNDETCEDFGLWVQIHNLPPELIGNKEVVEYLGAYAGPVLDIEDPTLRKVAESRKPYARVKVRINEKQSLIPGVYMNIPDLSFLDKLKSDKKVVDRSSKLKQKMKASDEGSSNHYMKSDIWVQFTYEKVHKICCICGQIGHSPKQCNNDTSEYAISFYEFLSQRKHDGDRVMISEVLAPMFNSAMKASYQKRDQRKDGGNMQWMPTSSKPESSHGPQFNIANLQLILASHSESFPQPIQIPARCIQSYSGQEVPGDTLVGWEAGNTSNQSLTQSFSSLDAAMESTHALPWNLISNNTERGENSIPADDNSQFMHALSCEREAPLLPGPELLMSPAKNMDPIKELSEPVTQSFEACDPSDGYNNNMVFDTRSSFVSGLHVAVPEKTISSDEELLESQDTSNLLNPFKNLGMNGDLMDVVNSCGGGQEIPSSMPATITPNHGTRFSVSEEELFLPDLCFEGSPEGNRKRSRLDESVRLGNIESSPKRMRSLEGRAVCSLDEFASMEELQWKYANFFSGYPIDNNLLSWASEAGPSQLPGQP